VVLRWGCRKSDQSLAVAVNGPSIVDNANIVIRAAIDGVGLAFTFEKHAAPHRANGTCACSRIGALPSRASARRLIVPQPRQGGALCRPTRDATAHVIDRRAVALHSSGQARRVALPDELQPSADSLRAARQKREAESGRAERRHPKRGRKLDQSLDQLTAADANKSP
jgi:hypothetical protein